MAGSRPGRPGTVLSRRERLQAALHGEPTDRTPISLWHHFPGRDATPEALVEVTWEFQRHLDPDFIKLMPTGMYPVLDYGVRVRPSDDAIGTTRFAEGPIREPADWRRLPRLSPSRGVLGQQVETVRRLRARLGPDVPIIQTIFSPLVIADKLVGGKIADWIGAAEQPVREALGQVSDEVVAFGQACLEAGVDGFFFATQLATRSALPAGIYRRLGVPYDLRTLEPLRAGSWCLLLHLHGVDPQFELADLYPVDGVNWHDRETAPSLAQALGRTRRCLVAGIARQGAVAHGRPAEAAAEVRDAIAQTGGRRVIVAPGCVIPTTAPPENLLAARRAVDL